MHRPPKDNIEQSLLDIVESNDMQELDIAVRCSLRRQLHKIDYLVEWFKSSTDVADKLRLCGVIGCVIPLRACLDFELEQGELDSEELDEYIGLISESTNFNQIIDWPEYHEWLRTEKAKHRI